MAAAADPAAERRRLIKNLQSVKHALLALLVPALDGTEEPFAMKVGEVTGRLHDTSGTIEEMRLHAPHLASLAKELRTRGR